MEAKSDTTSERGLSTDQIIALENLNERREERADRQREATLVGLSIEEAAISRQIAQTEKRAEVRFPDYDSENVF